MPVNPSQLLAALAAALLFPTTVSAQTPGDLGAMSRSAITISANVAPRMRMSGLRDVKGIELSSRPQPQSLHLCLSANTNTRVYSVTALDPSDQSDFVLVDSAGHRTPFSVEWTSRSGPPVAAQLTPGIAAHGFLATDDCVATSLVSASLAVRLPPRNDRRIAQLGKATLILLIVPE